MKQTNKILALLLVITVAIFGCDTFWDLKVYSSDLREMLAGSGKLDVYASLGASYTDENYEQTKTFIVNNFRGVKNIRKGTKQNELSGSVLHADYKMPIVRLDQFDSTATDIITLVLRPQTGAYDIGIYLNKTRFNELNSKLMEELTQTITMDNLQFSFEFNNDLAESLKTTWRGVYVNGYPAAVDEVFVLEKRDRVNVEFSKLLKESMDMKNEPIYFGTVQNK